MLIHKEKTVSATALRTVLVAHDEMDAVREETELRQPRLCPELEHVPAIHQNSTADELQQ